MYKRNVADVCINMEKPTRSAMACTFNMTVYKEMVYLKIELMTCL